MPMSTTLRLGFLCAALGGVLLATPSPAVAQVVLHDISGIVWRDRVPDGIRAAHEQALGIPNYTVELRDGVSNAMMGSVTTDAEGRYQFRFGSTQPSRSYRLYATAPIHTYRGFAPRRAGNDRTVDSEIHPSGAFAWHSDPFVVVAGDPVSHMDIGLIMRPINVGDFAWLDWNGNGLQGASERGLQGLRVEAWNTQRNVLFAQASTDALGKYRLELPGWGAYHLRFELPNGVSFTDRRVGNDPTIDSDPIASGGSVGWTDVDYGVHVLSSVSVDAGYRLPPNALDAAVDYAAPPPVVFPGFSVAWSLRVREGVDAGITAARIRAAVPVGIQGMSWTCQGSGGAICPSSGVNALDFTVSLPARGALQINFAGQVAGNAPAIIVANADATIGAPGWDAFPGNNAALLHLLNDRLFVGNFQP